MALALPDFPWDSLAPYAATAKAHLDGLIDLSVGTPVDPTPAVIQDALAAATNAPGYPMTWGTPAVREAVAGWFARRRGVPDLDPGCVLPSIGSKEMVALLPTLLGLGAGDLVIHPDVAYPTYDVGARVAGATPVPVADPASAAEAAAAAGGRVRLVWLNSPGNPTGRVADAAELAAWVAWARSHDAVVASDECYAELGWEADSIPSLLDPAVTQGSLSGLLSLYSLSKQSNLAGYRAAFAAGDPALVAQLLEVRKHLGLMMPAPVQAAMIAALGDDAHVQAQKELYRARREVAREVLLKAGFQIDHSQAGLYLWCTRGEPALTTVNWLAQRGVLAAPGSFYGARGANHVRIAMTASDAAIGQLAQRLL